ncbi:hypothetical protein NMG60_11021590 [Bertholletia excelsa]
MFCRKIAEKFLLASRSSSARCLLHVLLEQQQSRLPTAFLPKHYSLYSTASSLSSLTVSKNQQEKHGLQQEPQSSGSRTSLETLQKPIQVPWRDSNMKNGLNARPVSITDWPRPSEIPWQAKVANSVSLIGCVQIPVQFEASPDGKYWAGTIISQQDDDSSDSSPFWIPVIFEGDLAHIAACHLKEKDFVYIAGQLSADPPPFTTSQGQANVQVMVRSLNYVQKSFPMKKAFPLHNLDKCEDNKIVTDMEDNGDHGFKSWRDLVNNPQNWWDHRENKLNGLMKPKHPDFTHKDSRHGLWLNSAPKWVFSRLDGLVFDVQIHKMKQKKASKEDASWNDLVENPDKWWDNRTDKISKRSPDFRHKVTSEALWLSDSPAWVLSGLPPLKSKQTGAVTITTATGQQE